LKPSAGVRVLVFPSERLNLIDELLRKSDSFKSWAADPINYAKGFPQAPKYFGFCDKVSDKVQGEFQVVPMLVGLFWEVEHPAMYKPSGWAKGIENDHEMNELRAKVESSLMHFEGEFEKFVKRNSQSPS